MIGDKTIVDRKFELSIIKLDNNKTRCNQYKKCMFKDTCNHYQTHKYDDVMCGEGVCGGRSDIQKMKARCI